MKIGIIGSGISGLGAGLLLAPEHDITIYEKNGYAGGHSRTVDVKTKDGLVPVDTGFIVFNHRNYPLLTGLFRYLDVPVIKSDMSFGVSINDGWLEYGTLNLENMVAQKINLIRLQYWLMVRDVFRFNRKAQAYLNSEENLTIGQCLEELGMGRWFREYFLLAMGGAIWSTPLEQMLNFPAKTFIRFFDNHGLLSLNDQPQWYTVKGGSREYVKRITHTLNNRIRLNSNISVIARRQDHIEIKHADGTSEKYDQVIFACHSDQALRLLDNPTEREKALIGSIKFQENRIVLHSDVSFMPRRRKAWSSWVYLSETRKDKRPCVSLSYWMNNLQSLETSQPIIVTLNPGREPDPELIQDEHVFEHPVFTAEAIKSQGKIDEIQGKDRIWYCGAWLRYGFHEDGLLSAVNVAGKLGAKVPWL